MLRFSCTGFIRIEGKLSQPGLAYLWDHRIAGRELLPAAAMLEAASAALAAVARGGAIATPAVLVDVRIPAPLVLPTRAAEAPTLAVRFDARKSVLAVESGVEAQNKMWTTHLRAGVAFVRGEMERRPTSASLRFVEGLLSSPLLRKGPPIALGVVMQRNSTLQPQEYGIDPAVLDNCTQVHPTPQYVPAKHCLVQ